MRILMVSDVYFPWVNGVSTSNETFRRTLAALGVGRRSETFDDRDKFAPGGEEGDELFSGHVLC